MRNLSFLIAAAAAVILLIVAFAVWGGAPSGIFIWAGWFVVALIIGVVVALTRRRRGERMAHRPGGP